MGWGCVDVVSEAGFEVAGAGILAVGFDACGEGAVAGIVPGGTIEEFAPAVLLAGGLGTPDPGAATAFVCAAIPDDSVTG